MPRVNTASFVFLGQAEASGQHNIFLGVSLWGKILDIWFLAADRWLKILQKGQEARWTE